MLEYLVANGHPDPKNYSARQVQIWYALAVKRGFRERSDTMSDRFIAANSNGKSLSEYLAELEKHGG